MAVAVDSATARFSDLCRLCATKTGIIHGLNIFANDANYRQIFKKIEACLPIQISESDLLPKMVCENCLYKVELLFDFRERALRTESVLIELFKQLHSHPLQLQGGHSSNHHVQHGQHLKLDVSLDHVMSQSQSNNLLNDGLTHDIDLPQLSHRDSMIILSQHNVPLDQLSQHDINQELSNHSIDTSDNMLVAANSYSAIEYQHHHILTEDINLSHSNLHSIKNIVDHDTYSSLNDLNHEKNGGCSGGIQRLMMNEAHFMHDHLNDDETIDSIISSIFCSACGKSFEDKVLLEQHYQEHYSKPCHTFTQEKELENSHRKELHGSSSTELEFEKVVVGTPIGEQNHKNLVDIVSEAEHSEQPSAHLELQLEKETIQEVKEINEKPKLEQCSDADSDMVDNNYDDKLNNTVDENQEYEQDHDSEEPTNGKKKKFMPKVCNVCGKEYKTNYKLTEHMRRHTGEQPYKCGTCDKAFRSKIGLAQHEATHTGQYVYSCKTCGKGFQCRSYLMVHQRVHSDVKPYPCSTCDRSFKTKQSLLDHTNRHLGVKPYTCEECKRSFITSGLLRAHQKTHSGTDNRKYECAVCNKMFVSKSYLQIHSRIHTGEKPFKCEVCGKGFLARVDLKIHSTMHTGEKSYVCEICGKAFARRDALRCHRRSHTGERPYKCDFCGQTFTQFSPMAIHKRLHTGERPYECEVCGEKFVSRSTMMVHFKKHVKNEKVTIASS